MGRRKGADQGRIQRWVQWLYIEGDNGDLIKKETSSKSPREIRHLVLPTEKHCRQGGVSAETPRGKSCLVLCVWSTKQDGRVREN